MSTLPWTALALLCLTAPAAAEPTFRSHPPQRPLPAASDRPLSAGPALFVDAAKGDDRHDGSKERPWKTLAHAVTKLKPGDTLYLRGGVYYEHVTLTASGTAERPITVRSFPGELAILDGGLREFFASPTTAWEPCPDGVPGEFRSVKTYPDLGGDATHTNVLGNFGDSLVPLHGYRTLGDLRSDNVYWNLKNNVGLDNHIYCGPGLFYDVGTGRIHVRLAPTKMKYLPAGDNYAGATDPRRLPLIVAGHKGGSPLTLRGVRHVVVQDLVVRGSRAPTITVAGCSQITFDGLTVYGGASCFLVTDTAGVRLINTACRGLAAPWTFRGSLKYRAIESRLFSTGGWTPSAVGNRDFELAHSEFTDSVDGVFVGNVRGVRFHHNLLDNVSDDGLFLTAGTAYDGHTPGGDVHVYQNLLSRCLTTFAFGTGHGRQKATPAGPQTGAGVHVYRNVFDFRRPVLYHQPKGPDVPQEVTSRGRFAGDHGGPAWEPLFAYHNTILADDPATYAYGTVGLGDHVIKGTKRRVFNNLVVQMQGLPGTTFPKAGSDFQGDGNLFWSVGKGPAFVGDPFAKFRRSQAFADSKTRYEPGWGAGDRFADPRFVRLDTDWRKLPDLRLQPDSPAVNAGVSLPRDWPDPLRPLDKGPPDVGALPLGVSPWTVGVRGRLTVNGVAQSLRDVPSPTPFAPHESPPRSDRKPAAIVAGYPAFDAPLLDYALRRQGAAVDVFEKAWLDPKEYGKYGVVAVIGSLARAKVEPRVYTPDDLRRVDAFLKDGGTLLLMVAGRDVFRTPEGQKYLANLTGDVKPAKDVRLELREPKQAWVKHLDPARPHPWIEQSKRYLEYAVRADRGERVIGSPTGHATLYRVPVGKGQLIYVGWEVAASLPMTRRRAATLEEERLFEEQMRVLRNIAAELYPTRAPSTPASR